MKSHRLLCLGLVLMIAAGLGGQARERDTLQDSYGGGGSKSIVLDADDTEVPVGVAVTLSATLSDAATGKSVQFMLSGTPFGEPLLTDSQGTAAKTYVPSVAGIVSFSAIAIEYGSSNIVKITATPRPIQVLLTKWAAEPDGEWQSSGTTICAGGKALAVHEAKIHIGLDASAKGKNITITLTGGDGFAPTKSWWTPDDSATRASLAFQYGMCIPGGTIQGTVGNDDSDLEIDGILLSSNAVESVTIQVQVEDGIPMSTSVAFEAPTYTSNLTYQGFVLNSAAEFAVTATYKGYPVEQHNLKFIVYSVTHGSTTELCDPNVNDSNGYLHDLTGWVKIGTSNNCWQDAVTNAQGIAIANCKVVNANVTGFVIGIGDMSVAVPH